MTHTYGIAVKLFYHMYIRRLFGTSSRSVSSDWIITHVNFTSVFARTCESSDYENWTVSDGVNN